MGEISPDRFVTFADDTLPSVTDPSKSASQYAGFLMWNQYFGTWHGAANLLPGVIAHIHSAFPDKMVVVSEFGVAGIFAPDAVLADNCERGRFATRIAELQNTSGSRARSSGVIRTTARIGTSRPV